MTTSEEVVDDFLKHFGVKGMRWGVRKSRPVSSGSSKSPAKTPTKATPVKATVEPGKRVKTVGGENHKASPDAVRVAKLNQKAKKSTVDSLSNEELQKVVNRMNLEQQYSRLTAQDAASRRHPAQKFVAELLLSTGKQQASQYANKQVAELLKKQG